MLRGLSAGARTRWRSALPFIHAPHRSVHQPRLAAMVGDPGGVVLRRLRAAGVRRHPQRHGDDRRLAALQVRGAQDATRGAARPRRHPHVGGSSRARRSTPPGATATARCARTEPCSGSTAIATCSTPPSPRSHGCRKSSRGLSVEIADRSRALAALALQGPTSRGLLRSSSPSSPDSIAELGFFRLAETQLGGVPAMVSRTGYTGDLGYEVWVDGRSRARRCGTR